MEFVTRRPAQVRSIALFPGAWNPPTRAHLAIAEAALGHVEALAFVLARVMPHKTLQGAQFEQRVAWLAAIAARDPRYSVAISDGGLFIDMANECRDLTQAAEICIVCGTDAAHRIVTWDYGDAVPPMERQLDHYALLVAPRGAAYEPPEHLRPRIRALHLPGDWHDVSSSDVRRRIDAGEDVAALVPEEIAASVRGAQS